MAFVFVCLLFDFLAKPAWEFLDFTTRGTTITDAAVAVIVGCIAGQIGFAALIAGFGAIRWIRGFSVASLLAILAYGTWIASLKLSLWLQLSFEGEDIAPALWLGCLAPVALFVSSLPFAIARIVMGWYLTSKANDRSTIPFSINDFFISTIVVAALAYLVSAPQQYIEIGRHYWMVQGVGALILGGFSLFCFLPLSLIALKIEFLLIRIIFYLIAALATWLTLILILVSLSAPRVAEACWFTFIGVVWAGATLGSGLESIRLGGFRIARIGRARSTNTASTSSTPSDSDQTSSAKSPWDAADGVQDELAAKQPFGDSVFAAYLCAAFVFSLAVFAGATKFGLELRHRWRLQELNELAGRYLEQGGELFLTDDFVSAARLGPQGTNAQLQELTQYLYQEGEFPRMLELDLSNSKVDDEAVQIINRIYGLYRLNISHSRITENGVRELLSHNRVYQLHLAGIPLSRETLLQLLARDDYPMHYLDLSDTGLTIEDLSDKEFHSWPSHIALRNMRMTDQNLVDFLQKTSVVRLDVSDNQLTGEFLLKGPHNYQYLDLVGNPLIDANIALAVEQGTTVDYLKLGEDSLSDKSLPDVLAMAEWMLVLEEGSFSEEAIISSAGEFHKLGESLRLHGKQFTGRALSALEESAGLEYLDMSHSGVTAANLRLAESSLTWTLDLSRTEIDDRAVPVLSKMQLDELNLGHTAITAEGVVSGDWGRVQKIVVTPGQFTNEELDQMRRVVKVDIWSHQQADF